MQVSIQLLQNIFKGLEEGSISIPWPAVHHLVGSICYGGKVTDAQDMRALRALLIKNCSAESIDEGYGTVQVHITYKDERPFNKYVNPLIVQTVVVDISRQFAVSEHLGQSL